MQASINVSELVSLRESIDALIERAFPTGRFTNHTLNLAIVEIVAGHPQGIGVTDIENQLRIGGYRTRSSNFRCTLHNACIRLGAKGAVKLDQSTGRKILRPVK